MPTVSTQLYYSAPLTPAGPHDGWVIDALSNPPEIVRNFRKEEVAVTITDLRDADLRPTLDDMGFELAAVPTLVDPQAIAENSAPALERYQQETAELLTARTKADEVVFFDSTLRGQETGVAAGGPNQSPHLRVHVDQSPRSALARAKRHGTPGHGFRRFQIINVWRPLLHPVRNFPLAMCDFRTLDPATDLVVTRLRFPAWLKDRENYSVKFNPSHRWYYWGSLSPDEALVFKCYDSASRGLALAGDEGGHPGLIDVAGLCPHTAFLDPDGPTTGRIRTSVELRALLFYR
jgi:cephamycin C biosynthesis protein